MSKIEDGKLTVSRAPLYLKQVLDSVTTIIYLNLLSNSVEFTPEHGKVYLEVRRLVWQDGMRLRFTASRPSDILQWERSGSW